MLNDNTLDSIYTNLLLKSLITDFGEKINYFML